MNSTEENWSLRFLLDSRYWMQRALLPCVVFIGLLGNIASIIVLTRKRMRSSTNTYLTALAVSDILILIFHMYLSFENEKVLNENIEYITYWEYWRFAIWLDDAALGISVWLTVSFTCERYVAVCHPLKGKVFCTVNRARKLITIVFIVVPLSLITTPFEHSVGVVVNPETNKTSMYRYSDLRQDPIYKNVFFWFIPITYVFIPLIILAVLNTLLVNAVRKSRRRRSTLTQAKYKSSFKQRQENKITMTLVAVVFLFLVCQTPQTVVLVIDIFYVAPPYSTANNILRGLGNISNFLLALNAASNFILYCAMSDQYRRTLALTFFPTYYKRRCEINATLRSDASFRLSSFRQSSFMRNSSIRSDQRNSSFKSERSPSSEMRKGILSETIKETPECDESVLKDSRQRRVSLSPNS